MPTLAMDSETRTIRRWQALQTARNDVQPFVGELMALDSAEAVYHAAIGMLGHDVSDLPQHATTRAVWQHFARSRGASPRVAMDSAGRDRLREMFPNWDRVNG